MPSVLVADVGQEIGRRFAQDYAARGWTVFAAGPGGPFDALPNVVSVSYDPMAEGGADRLARQLAGTALDVLIVVGGAHGTPPPPDDTSPAVWQSAMITNALAPLELISRLKANVMAGGQKKIVAVSRCSASMALPGEPGDYISRASRAAMHQLLRCIAAEWNEPGCSWIPICPAETPDVDASVQAMRQVIASAVPREAMSLLSHDGRELPW
ncbi:SDR family NAD(P)-dependent oxidoreductase [Pelagibacterium lacus]|uniref:SDR family NAD(P)-dependent oxidoreductase n=1 Tax=Pelagibacterium lacus TaxID=2282655 RepID=A0A369W4C2_9HYPH|nr:SDR family NAD(P)-dependent oxidoreductase [Pelagibacterium lacus]RDE09544.1 SDR family NAD(P)-dependent oxidoreductase [Pelagibacterium lacus]